MKVAELEQELHALCEKAAHQEAVDDMISERLDAVEANLARLWSADAV
jgi:hypothetical protein